MAGGADAAIARVQPLMRDLGKMTHMGPVGAGQATKLVNQTLVALADAVLDAPAPSALSHANRVSDRSFPRSGETVFGLPETEGPELPLKWSFFPAETASRL